MLTTRHPVDFAYTRPELEALFAYARQHDVERGGRYDARSAAINLWSHHWANDATREALQPLLDREPRLTYVHSDEPGLSRAYNNGIRRTTGEILVFTDDDCLAPKDWISSIVAAFEAEPDGDLLYGQVVPAGETREDERLTPAIIVGEFITSAPSGRVRSNAARAYVVRREVRASRRESSAEDPFPDLPR